MPDTKSGIKHLSNMASMHQNIFNSLRNVFTRQFKSNMKIYSQEINTIKDELARLKMEKEKYIIQEGDSHVKAMDLSTESTNTPDNEPEMTRSEAFEEIRRQNELTNEALAKKVQSFSNSPSSRRWSGSTIGLQEVEKELLAVNVYTSDKRRGRIGSGFSSAVIEELRESDEEEGDLYDEQLELNQTKQNRISRGVKTKLKPFHKPTFKNDRFVNTTVNEARAKLTALYRQSVLGPGSHRKRAHLSVPSLSSSSRTSTSIAGQQKGSQQPHGRSQSAAIRKTHGGNQSRKNSERNSKSAEPKLGRRSSLSGRKLTGETESPIPSPYMVTFDESVEYEPSPSKRRERYLKEIQENLTARYKNFEESLHRRMLIREMKAAEYDANHKIQSILSLQEVIPSKTSTMSEAVKRQSAIIALERSILGGLG